MQNLKSNNSFMISVALGSAVLLALASFWGFLLYKTHALKMEVATISGEAANANLTDSYISSVRNALRGAKDDLKDINVRFIGKDDVPAFIDMLEGKMTGFELKTNFSSIDLSEPGTNSTMRTLVIHVNGSGEWKNIMQFVANLDAMPYAISMKELNMSKQKEVWTFGATISQNVTN